MFSHRDKGLLFVFEEIMNVIQDPLHNPPWFCKSCKALMLQRGSPRMPADVKNTAVECGEHRVFFQTNRGDRWWSSANRSLSTPPSCPALQSTPHINGGGGGRQWPSVQRGARRLLYASIVLLPWVTQGLLIKQKPRWIAMSSTWGTNSGFFFFSFLSQGELQCVLKGNDLPDNICGALNTSLRITQSLVYHCKTFIRHFQQESPT